MSDDRDQHQALALAAVFQAALSADQLACGEHADSEALRSLMEGILALEPGSPEQVYARPQRLREGLELLRQLFSQGQRRQHLRAISYGLALMHLANRLRKDADLTSIVRHRLEALEAQRPHFPDLAASEFCHRAAGIYVDTLGSFNFRIRVQGDPASLRNDDTAARIRALFLAGVRAAFLWRQAGGRRWHLLFQRRRLLRAIDEILDE